jgi:hemoglobin
MLLKILATLSVLVCAVSGCAQAPSAIGSQSRDEPHGKNASVQPVPVSDLYQDLGGKPGVARLVDQLIENYRADARINVLFNETNFEYFSARLNEYICLRTGGGCEYKGLDMVATHSGMDIKEREFNYFVEDSQKAMSDVGIPVGVQNRLLKLLAQDQPDVVHQ